MSNRPNPGNDRYTAPQQGRSLVLPIVIGVIVFAAIGAIALTVFSSSGDDDDDSTAASASSSSDTCEMDDPRDMPGVTTSGGTALGELADEANDPAVGKGVPVLSGVDLCGEPMTIGDSGKPTVVVFLAHWCPHCQREVPLLSEWLATNGQPEGVDIVGVTTEFDEVRGNWPPGEWLTDEGWTQPTMVDPTGVANETWGLSGFPYYVVIDADGNVVMRASGEQTVEQVEAMVAAALASSGGGTTDASAS